MSWKHKERGPPSEAEAVQFYSTILTEVSEYNLSEKKINEYSESDLFIYNGLDKDRDYAVKMINLNSKLKVIDVATGMKYEHSIEELWLNPNNYLMMAENVKTGLSEYINNNPGVLGKRAEDFQNFPILIKFIDAKENLSIQVHPDDEYALKNNGEYGKTEMWYILDCEEDSFLYYGFNKEITKEEFKKSIENNTVLDYLNKVKVNKGDVFFIESGTVHAIGKGIVICEIQQNSNTTFRVYDYDRIDKDGNKRPLHIKEAIEVSETKPAKNYKRDGNTLAKCKYFTVEELEVSGKEILQVTEDTFKSVIVTDGCGEIKNGDFAININKGDSIFVPAQNDNFEIFGNCKLIVSYV